MVLLGPTGVRNLPDTQTAATAPTGNGFAVPAAAVAIGGGLILLTTIGLCFVTPQAYGPAALVIGTSALAALVAWWRVSSVPITLDLDH
ncbi:hypothetical protein KGO04_04520 [Patescibacteria group bacterium]|nr:hypothetical protein [Patescibacteria group bacterium]